MSKFRPPKCGSNLPALLNDSKIWSDQHVIHGGFFLFPLLFSMGGGGGGGRGGGRGLGGQTESEVRDLWNVCCPFLVGGVGEGISQTADIKGNVNHVWFSSVIFSSGHIYLSITSTIEYPCLFPRKQMQRVFEPSFLYFEHGPALGKLSGIFWYLRFTILDRKIIVS